MVKGYAKRKKAERRIEILKEELERNKKTYQGNIDLLKTKIKLQEASDKELVYQKKRYKLNKGLLEIEVKHCGIVNPMMEFHKREDWQKKFKEAKEFELESFEKDWEIAQQEHKNQMTQMSQTINEQEIEKQFERIKERNPEIIEQLKTLGVKIEIPKLDYIG